MHDPARVAFDRWLTESFCDYQKRWALDTAPIALATKARQIGYSYGTAGGCVFWGLGARRPQLVLSASQDLSDEVLSKARAHCELLAALGHRGATAFAVDNSTELAWRSGGRIVALPANPRTARSFAGDIWLDEYAYHTDPEGIRDGAFAMASRGDYRVRVFSTPNGAQGQFHAWATQPPEGWSVHRVTIADAAADGFPVDLDKLWKLAGGDPRVFAQWYQCAWLDDDLQYIPTAFADGALRWTGAVPELDDATIHAGLDVGRHHDLTVLTVVAVVGSVAWVLAIVPWRRTAFRAQKSLLAQARDLFRWSTLHVDATGLGSQLAEELVEQWGAEEVRPVTFTNESKADLATRALRWMRDRRVRYPQGDAGRALHAETLAVRRQVTAAGHVTYVVPRTAAGHGDRWWSFCLALRGCGEPIAPRGMGLEPLLSVA